MRFEASFVLALDPASAVSPFEADTRGDGYDANRLAGEAPSVMFDSLKDQLTVVVSLRGALISLTSHSTRHTVHQKPSLLTRRLRIPFTSRSLPYLELIHKST